MKNSPNRAENLRVFLPSLKRLGRLYRVLAGSGESVKMFCDWSVRHRTRFVPLFDFDVVCASLPSIAAERRIEEIESLRFGSLWLELGPHTLAATLLNRGPFTFSLPLGSLAELMSKREGAKTGLTRSAKHWSQAFEQAANAPDPPSRLLTQARNQPSAETQLLDAFVNMARQYDDVAILDTFCDRHVPYQNLVLDRYDTKVKRSFEMTEAKLNSIRPKVRNNNRRDAINVSNVVRMFNHPVQEKSGERPMPMFITETKEVFDIFEMGKEESWYDLSAYAEQPPRFFKRLLFLQIYWFFVTDCQFRMRTASREALLFAQQSNKLASQYLQASELIEELLDTRVNPRRQVFEIEYQLDWLVEQQRVFDDDWGTAIIRTLRSGEQDRISYINLLHNSHFRSGVSRSLKERIAHKEWGGIIEQLRGFRPDFEFWKLIDDYTRTQILIGTDIDQEFRFTFDDNSGESLLWERPGRKLSKLAKGELDKVHELRFLVHRRNVSNACVLSADSWQYNGAATEGDLNTSFIAFVWAHGCDKRLFWERAASFISCFFAFGENVAPISLREFRDTGMVEINISSATTEKVLSVTFGVRTAYLELCQGERVLYADLFPEDSLEMQVGVVFPRLHLGSLPTGEIASFIARTSIIPLGSDDCLAILKKLSTVIQTFSVE